MTLTLKEQAGKSHQAARTAATSLEAIETWARRTFYAAAVTAVFVTGTCLFGAYKYWQVTSAVASFGEHSRSVMNDPEVKASQARANATRAKLQATINGR